MTHTSWRNNLVVDRLMNGDCKSLNAH